MDHGFGNWPTLHAARNGDRPAYIDATSGRATTWREFDERTNQLADALSQNGFRRGDRVATLTLNSPQMMEIYSPSPSSARSPSRSTSDCRPARWRTS